MSISELSNNTLVLQILLQFGPRFQHPFSRQTTRQQLCGHPEDSLFRWGTSFDSHCIQRKISTVKKREAIKRHWRREGRKFKTNFT